MLAARRVRQVLRRKDELVIKPVEGSGGYGIVFGPFATREELDAIAKRIEANPRVDRPTAGVAVDQPDTVRTTPNNRAMSTYAPFAVNDGESVWCCPAA